MISRKELQYVNKKIGNVPYPGDDYAEQVMAELKEAYNLFNAQYNGKSYNMILSNGQEFPFSIMDKNLCHMLGIDGKSMFNSDYGLAAASRVLGVDHYVPTFEVLQRIIDNSDAVIANEKKEGTYKFLNFYKTMIKCAIFKKMTTFKDFNFGFINFDKSKYDQNTTSSYYSPNSTSYIFMPSDEALIPYFLVGFVQDNYSEFETLDTELFKKIKTNIEKCENIISQYNETIKQKLENIYTPLTINSYGLQESIKLLNTLLRDLEEKRQYFNDAAKKKKDLKNELIALNKKEAHLEIKPLYIGYKKQLQAKSAAKTIRDNKK